LSVTLTNIGRASKAAVSRPKGLRLLILSLIALVVLLSLCPPIVQEGGKRCLMNNISNQRLLEHPIWRPIRLTGPAAELVGNGFPSMFWRTVGLTGLAAWNGRITAPDPGAVLLTKSVLVKAVVAVVVLSGIVAALLKRRYGQRVESLMDGDHVGATLMEVYLRKKPPDPTPVSQYQKDRLQRNKLRSMARLITACCLIPMVLSNGEKELRSEIKGFIGKGGALHTENLNPELREKLRVHLGQLPKGLLGGVDDKTIDAILDSGASSLATPISDDFISYEKFVIPKTMEGIAGGLKIEGSGVIRYEMMDRQGGIRPLEREAYYIPGLPVRLIPPQCIFPDEDTGYCKIGGGQVTLNFANGQIVDSELDPSTNLPVLRVFHDAAEATEQTITALYTCVTEEVNQNLTPGQKCLLRWHFRLGHVAASVVKWMAQRGLLGSESKIIAATKDLPKCGTCQYAKQARRSTETTVTRMRDGKEGALKDSITEPGQGTAIDQFEVIKRGRLFSTYGKEKAPDKYTGGTIFVDIATGRVRCYFQHSLDADATVSSKLKYERESAESGVMVQSYHADNGVFTAQRFQVELIKEGQTIKLSGVGAHHQNAIAERAIRTVVTKARVLLLHAMLRWPDTTTPDLWPMAMQHAEYLANSLPRTATGLSPKELFSRSIADPLELQRLPVWGCPVYVLEPTLQDGRKLPKWQPRSRRGQFMGRSQLHASTVHLVRNLSSGRIGPQYHVVFDNWFETVHHDQEDEIPPEWDILVNHARWFAPIDDDDWASIELHDEWLTGDEILEKRGRIQREREKELNKHIPGAKTATPVVSDIVSDDTNSEGIVSEGASEGANTNPILVDDNIAGLPSPAAALKHVQFDLPVQSPIPSPIPSPRPRKSPVVPDEHSSLRRSGRNRNAPSRYGYDGDGVAGYLALVDGVTSMVSTAGEGSYGASVAYLAALMSDPDTGLLDTGDNSLAHLIPMALRAKKGTDPDLPNYGAAMRGPHEEEFKKGMWDEIKQLESHNTWRKVKRSSLPEGANVLPSTWAFRIKRLPNGLIRKFKARLCARGDKQLEGIDVFETYAPVVSWSTVRCLLAFALQEGLVTRQVDFSNAFVQATLPDDEVIFLEVPKDFQDEYGKDVVLKLDKSLYGLKQAPYHWFNTLKLALEQRGYKASENDKCMFIHPNGTIILSYVDDLLIFSKSEDTIKSLLDSLRTEFELTEEQIEQDKNHDVYSFLGIEVDIENDSEGKNRKPAKITLRQQSLIKKVLKEAKMENCNGKDTPAHEKPLGTDKNGAPFVEDWDYATVVGMLMYLVHTRPDIQFAVHQCARFTHCPRASHAEAIHRICRYLKGTADRGLELKPLKPGGLLQLDCYVDADFSGLYDVEDPLDPVSSKSRTGFVFYLGNCPVVWSSKLQQETSLSTVEAEYCGLSEAMRSLIPMRRLVLEIAQGLKLETTKSRVFSKVFEDNKGAIAVATAPAMTSRTKHINVKYHFFKSHIGEDKGIVIEHIGTEEQIADIFTKGLCARLFVKLRDKLMGSSWH
jgi:hypothetical protein